MTMITPQDFINTYNHTLSSTFSHPTLPFIHHSQNWSVCSDAVTLPGQPNALSLSTDGSLLAVSTGSDILIYSTEGGLTLNQTLKGHTGYVSNVEWYPGETKLVSGSSLNGRYSSREEVVWFWDLNKGSTSETRHNLDGVSAKPFLVQIDGAGEASMSQSRLSIFGGLQDQAQGGIGTAAEAATAAAAEVLIAQADWTEQEVKFTGLEANILAALHEAQMKRSIMRGVTFPGTLPNFGSSAFSPDGNIVFYLPNRNTVVGLLASNRTEVFRLEGHTDAIMWVGASPDGKLIATSSWDSTVKIWDISDGSLIKTLKGIKGQSWTGCWSPDSRFIAVGGGDRTVRVWDVRSGETVHAFGEDERLFSGWVRGLAFEASEGEYLTTAADGGTVRVFDMASGNCTNHYQIDTEASSPLHIGGAFTEISYSLKHAPGSSKRFGFKTTDGRLVVYDTERNEMWEFVQDREGSDRIFGSGMFEFARGGRRVYSGDTDGVVRMWDLD